MKNRLGLGLGALAIVGLAGYWATALTTLTYIAGELRSQGSLGVGKQAKGRFARPFPVPRRSREDLVVHLVNGVEQQ